MAGVMDVSDGDEEGDPMDVEQPKETGGEDGESGEEESGGEKDGSDGESGGEESGGEKDGSDGESGGEESGGEKDGSDGEAGGEESGGEKDGSDGKEAEAEAHEKIQPLRKSAGRRVVAEDGDESDDDDGDDDDDKDGGANLPAAIKKAPSAVVSQRQVSSAVAAAMAAATVEWVETPSASDEEHDEKPGINPFGKMQMVSKKRKFKADIASGDINDIEWPDFTTRELIPQGVRLFINTLRVQGLDPGKGLNKVCKKASADSQSEVESLVLIDGAHRLRAYTHLYNRKKPGFASASIPLLVHERTDKMPLSATDQLMLGSRANT